MKLRIFMTILSMLTVCSQRCTVENPSHSQTSRDLRYLEVMLIRDEHVRATQTHIYRPIGRLRAGTGMAAAKFALRLNRVGDQARAKGCAVQCGVSPARCSCSAESKLNERCAAYAESSDTRLYSTLTAIRVLSYLCRNAYPEPNYPKACA